MIWNEMTVVYANLDFATSNKISCDVWNDFAILILNIYFCMTYVNIFYLNVFYVTHFVICIFGDLENDFSGNDHENI